MSVLWEEKIESLDATEINWGGSTILAIFFAASLVSAVFFGMGYSFGRGDAPKPGSLGFIGSATAPAIDSGSSQFIERHNGVALTASAQASTTTRAGNNDTPIRPVFTHVSAASSHPAPVNAKEPASLNIRPKPAVLDRDRTRYMVQVGAINNRKDARMLVMQLRKRGLHAGIYPSKQDRFLHVQIGPFSSAEQAQMMRHHVIASGYRAILKRAS